MSQIPEQVYFVGIGGIGMSALARYFKAIGSEVAGYDLHETVLTRALVDEGMQVHYADAPELLPDKIDLAIYTPAVPADFGELRALRDRGCRLVKRAAALGIIAQRHKTLAVAGTHGKTTISAMAAYLMREADTDAVAFLGGISANYKTNYLPGYGEWLVVEADEYDRSFLQLTPSVAIVSFIEADHLDIYDGAADFEATFEQFVGQIKAGGTLVTKPHIAKRLSESICDRVTVQTYSADDEVSADWQASNIKVENGAYSFDLTHHLDRFINIVLAMPGRHNVENAVAAIAAVVASGVDIARAVKLISGFKGVERRFEILGKWNGATVISDYAHHPTEVKAAVLSVLELFGSYKVIGIFQPHLYSRTRDFATEFASVLSDLQHVVMLELYPAREKPIAGVDSNLIFSNITSEKKYLVSTPEAPALLRILDGDVLLFMGAGSIDDLARSLV